MRKNNHILTFDHLAKCDSLVHGFSTQFFGNMHPESLDVASSLKKFSQTLAIDPQKVVRMGQVHGSHVAWAKRDDAGKIILQTDALLTSEKNLFLGIVTADCVPVLFYDPKRKYIGAVHAGWRGLFSEIIKEAIGELVNKGSDPGDILVGIGPCIGACCYDIAKKHAEKLLEKFPGWKDFVSERDGKLFLDLAQVAKYQLCSLGIPDTNIEDADFCTNDHPSELYSYRREGESTGRFIGVIGLA